MNVVTQDDYEKVLAKAKRMGQMVNGLKISTMNSEVIKPKILEDIYLPKVVSPTTSRIDLLRGKVAIGFRSGNFRGLAARQETKIWQRIWVLMEGPDYQLSDWA